MQKGKTTNIFRIVTANVRGIADKTKRKAILEYYRVKSDILILQETHSEDKDEYIWESEWGGDIIFNHGTSNSKGIMVLLPKGMKKQINNVYKCTNGRKIIFDLMENQYKITIAAIYAPNTDDPGFFKELRKTLSERGENKIIVGDFNLTMDIEMDRKDTYHNNNKAKTEIEDMADEFCLKDTWRIQNPEKREYSWFKSGNIRKASRIDFALVTGGLDQKIKEALYLPSIMSDHRAFYMVIEVNMFERGSGYWKFNTKYLQDKDFLQHMNNELDCTINSISQKNPLEKWEIIKQRIKKIATDYSRMKTSEDKLIIGELSEIVNDYQANFPLNKEETILLENTKLDLDEKLMENAKGMIFRSKVKWHELGEKSTK